MPIRHRIMARTPAGAVFECFVWDRGIQAGIDRAFADAEEHGVAIADAWAESM